MKPRWIIAGAAALALGILTLPMLRSKGAPSQAPATSAASADAAPDRSATCDATGKGKLDFVLKDQNDHDVHLADFKGKVVLLNFWATWCGPCKEEIPTFVEMYDKYHTKGLEIVGVSIDDKPEQLRPFMQQWHMQYPVVQMQSDIESEYGPFFGVPTSFFLARDGAICTKHLGPVTKEQFEQQMKALL